MPPRRSDATPAPSTALALPQDMMDDLLRAQAEAITTPQRMPRVKIMPAAAGLFEFEDNNDTARDFVGVVLHTHPRNSMWDHAYGSEVPEEEKGPACQSNDGKFGTPRASFEHAGGEGPVACATCPYAQWESAGLLNLPNKNPRGKACSLGRSVYIAVEGRATPVEMSLPPTSVQSFDEYLASLLNQRIPVQAVVTKFKQRIDSKGSMRWAVLAPANEGTLSAEQFSDVMAKRETFMPQMTPRVAAGAPDQPTW